MNCVFMWWEQKHFFRKKRGPETSFSEWVFYCNEFGWHKIFPIRLDLAGMHLPRKTIPIAAALSRGNEIVAYVVPLSAAKPESSDCAGDIARSPKKNRTIMTQSVNWILNSCNKFLRNSFLRKFKCSQKLGNSSTRHSLFKFKFVYVWYFCLVLLQIKASPDIHLIYYAKWLNYGIGPLKWCKQKQFSSHRRRQ